MKTMTRRTMLGLMAGLPAALRAAPAPLSTRKRKRMGVTAAAYAQHWRAGRSARVSGGFKDGLDFLERSHELGAGGIQTGVRQWAEEFGGKIRDRRESYGMYLEGQISLPKDVPDVNRFDSEIRVAKEAGAEVFRAVMLSGRRYETFDTAESFREFRERSWNSLVLAERIVNKHRVRLAIENHKDWRVPELLEFLRRIDSEYVGVCVDTGNSISLLEDPMEVVEAYAPWAFTVHFKDMGMQEYEEGFLLSEVPFGEGFLDLRRMIDVLEKGNRDVQFNLEMITRDPLRVPCLTREYWATFETLPGKYLAETLARVRANPSKEPLPETSGLTPEGRLAFEEENNRKCFQFARAQLGL